MVITICKLGLLSSCELKLGVNELTDILREGQGGAGNGGAERQVARYEPRMKLDEEGAVIIECNKKKQI